MAIVMPRSRSSGALSMLPNSLAVVDVSDRPHVHMRFPALKFLFAHSLPTLK